ncbi:MAG: 1-deoxy-D-xylulose-5-phosphate synthase [Clostridia bacterium]|nr:1-deoxy-D-xylulose-5-phosphate synthase [Clostridia bacterium]
MKLLDNINSPKDLKSLSIDQLYQLAQELRDVIINTVFKNGGHLASNLGVIELIIAIEYVFNLPKDKLIFDVGHQCYAHKLLTGRYKDFSTLRQTNGISGFPRREESIYDVASTGHASTALSIACGLVRSNIEGNVISLIGDGSLTGGLSYEALNDMATLRQKQIIILNDNDMSISKTVGYISRYLNGVHGGGDAFGEYGLNYLDNIDGHNIEDLISALTYAKSSKRSIVLHVRTIKGKGLTEAELDPERYHGYSPKHWDKPSFSKIMGAKLSKMADQDKDIFAITAAMEEGTGLEVFEKAHKNRFIDVGICEAHAATMASGLALGGKKPYFAVYSTFMQRAFDSILHDICLSNLNVTFCVDRAGIVSGDGETHQGIYDVSFLRLMPNMVIASPKDSIELENMLEFSGKHVGPLTIRYPKGNIRIEYSIHEPIELGKWEYLNKNDKSDVVILATGATCVSVASHAIEFLQQEGINPTLINARFVKPLDSEVLNAIKGKKIVTLEDNVISGSFGSAVAEYYVQNNIYDVNLHILGINDKILKNASQQDLLEQNGLDSYSVRDFIKTL